MDVAVNNITTTITIPQVDFNLLKDLAKKFGLVIQTENKSGIEEALDDVKSGRVYHAENAHDLIKQCLVWNINSMSYVMGSRWWKTNPITSWYWYS